MKKLLILCLTFTIATELEVDGNLKVTGDIDASGNPVKNIGLPTTLNDAINGNALQDALRNEGPYEYLAYKVSISPNSANRGMSWMQLTESGDGAWTDDFVLELNAKSLEGYEIHSMMNLPYFYAQFGASAGTGVGASTTGNTAYTLFMLKRRIEE